MQQLFIIAGSAGSGKTTLSAKLALSLPHGARIEGDQLYSFVCREFQSPIEDDGGDCGRMFRSNCVVLARNFLAAGKDLVINHIFSPAQVQEILSQLPLQGLVTRAVWLDLPVADLIKRDAQRRKPEGEEAIRACHQWYAARPAPDRFVLNAEGLTTDAILDRFCKDERFLVTDTKCLMDNLY